MLKTIVPALVIVGSGLLALILGPHHLLQRVTIGTSSLVGAIMFHINLTSQLPPIGYLTIADKFMLVNYLALVGALLSTVVMYTKVTDRDALEAPPNVIAFHQASRAIVPITWRVGLERYFPLYAEADK